jgi:hypothetical protein
MQQQIFGSKFYLSITKSVSRDSKKWMKYKSIVLAMCYKIVKVTFYEKWLLIDCFGDTDHHESLLHVADEPHGDPVNFNAQASQGGFEDVG